ncbi:MAG: tetratricopeptide repeat protein [Deltaproteobacteria bacterium]|nr:tetratricopeptide repeat protein [Deltaproteobacteria bacterium]
MQKKRNRDVEDIRLVRLLEKVDKLYQNGKIDEAREEIQQIIKSFPYNPEPYLWLGDLLFLSSDNEGALDAYKKAIELDERNGEAHSSLAKIYLMLGKFLESERHADIALNYNPEDPEALFIKAIILERQKNYDLSEHYFKKSNFLDPENYPLPLNISKEYLEALTNFIFQNISGKIKGVTANYIIEIDEVPSDEDVKSGLSPLALSNLITMREDQSICFKMVIFRRNLLRFAQNEEELREVINTSLLNEISKSLTIIEKGSTNVK